MPVWKRANVIIVGIIAGISLVVGVLFGLVFAGAGSSSIVSEDACTRENKCLIVPFNGSRYQITGEAYEAYEKCSLGQCTWQTVNGTTYMFEGEAYQAYLVLDNLAEPLHKIRYDSQYIDDRPYLISIEGPTLAVQEIVSNYDITENGTKVTPDNRWTSFYGWIYQEDLARFLNENSVDSLGAKSVTVTPIGSYSLEQGVTVYGIPAQIPDDQQFMAERNSFIQAEMSKIVGEKAGVTKIDGEDLVLIESDDSVSKEFG